MSGVAIIVQARLGSTRCPGKVLADIGGTPLLGHLIRRLSRARCAQHLVIATSSNQRDDAIATFCASLGQLCFRGSEENVLERYVLCARELGATGVVRITADNPLVDPRTVDAVTQRHRQTGADLVDGIHRRSWVKGLGCEFVDVAALEVAFAEAETRRHLEHVTTFLKDHPERFRVEKYLAPPELSRDDMCVSVDYPEDLEVVRQIVAHWGADMDRMTTEEVVAFLADHSEIASLNRDLHPPLPD